MKTNNSKKSAKGAEMTKVTKVYTLAEVTSMLINRYQTIGQIKDHKRVINAYLIKRGVKSYSYKEVITACKEAFRMSARDSKSAVLAKLSYDSVMQAVAPIVFGSAEYMQLAEKAARVGVLSIDNVTEFCRKYYTRVTADGTLLSTSLYTDGDGEVIVSKNVARKLTETNAVSVLKQSLTNFARVYEGCLLDRKAWSNLAVEGAIVRAWRVAEDGAKNYIDVAGLKPENFTKPYKK